MAYVPGCSADAFISYAHDDNLDGWVTGLKEKLTQKLNPFLSKPAEVWFDAEKLQAADSFREEIREKLKNTPLFVAVVSTSYLESEFCMVEELEWFQNHGGREIFQLVKVPLEEGYEVPLPDLQYEKLYEEADGQALTDEPLDKALNKIVLAMTNKLRESRDARPKIYLAQVRDPDAKSRWDELKVKIHAEGYAILPKGILPVRVPDGQIRKSLEKALLSIHLGGAQNDPLAQRQAEIARQVDKPVITLPDPPRADELEAVVGAVRSKLEAARKPAIYCIYDHYMDGALFSGLFEPISDLTGCDVLLSETGEKYHKFRLRASDGILLFRGEAPEEWLHSQEQVLLQTAALRGDRFVAEAQYFTRRANGEPPGVSAKQGARKQWIIERTGEPNVEDLRPSSRRCNRA